jgi:hypothetical protein
VLDGLRRSFEIEGEYLQLPFQRHRRRRIANRLVTALILNTRRQFDFDTQSDAAARDHRPIRLCNGEVQMRRFDILAHFFDQLVNVKVSSSATRKIGGPAEEIFTA